MLIREPVHGDIFFNSIEAALLDAAELQRLRGIKQTGTGYLVYPGCVHTRFDHSIGTVHVAKRILTHLRHKGFSINQRDESIITAAALTHDVGHIPFGHTLEDEVGIFPRHDRARRLEWFFTGTDLAQRMEQFDLLEPVTALLTGRDHPEVRPWMRQIVMSTIDADMLDYLKRDSFFSGIRQQYDERVFSYFEVVNGQLALGLLKHGAVRPDARTEILNLLRMRYVLTERIYLHHTKVIAGAMLAKGLERLILAGLVEQDLYTWQDCDFFRALQEAGDPVARRLAGGVYHRRLLKRAYVLMASHIDEDWQQQLIRRFAGPQNAQARLDLEGHLARELGLEEGDIIIYCPQRSPFKEVKALVPAPNGDLIPLDSMDEPIGQEVNTMARQYADLWRFYVLAPPGAVDRARQLCQEVFQHPSSQLAG